jgi:hypothetical protein
MSNQLAIAAVTATLRKLLLDGINSDPHLNGAIVSAQPPDKARGNNSGSQINLFLYLINYNAALRNANMNAHLKPGEIGYPPLALNLYYLITSYGNDNEDIEAHQLLAKAMSILHDNPVLNESRIENSLVGNDLYQQIEKIRITHQPMSLDEMSKLWMTLQTQYRISTAYQVSVVLIDSTRPIKSPLPVISRGDDGRGAAVISALQPMLIEALPPDRKPSIEIGDLLTLIGYDLSGEIELCFKHMGLGDQIFLKPDSASSKEITVTISKDKLNDASIWPAGLYTVSAKVIRGGLPDMFTNKLPVTLAPQITVEDNVKLHSDIELHLNVKPKVRPSQSAILLFGSSQFKADKILAPTDILKFSIPGAEPDIYLVRLRIDGVADSNPLDRTSKVPKFDENQKVTVI